MIFQELQLAGIWRVALRPVQDERGFFARTYCAEEFSAHGLIGNFEQSSLSRNLRAGTLRGMHFQKSPFAETKFVRCVRGAIYDVVIDLREGSPTLGRWVGERLDAEGGLSLYIPAGFAHGFQCLEDNTDVQYQISPAFRPGHGAGVRWNDPQFSITWPLEDPILSARDAGYPDWTP